MKNTIFLSIIMMLSIVGISQESSFSTKWSNGYKVTSADKKFNMKFGGRVQWDNAFFSYDDALDTLYGDVKNGTEFRRVRFFNQGSIYGNVKYKMQLDFGGGKIGFKDVFITIGGIPVLGNLTVGHFKEPFRLVSLTSSKYISFMERAFPTNMIPERNVGFMFANSFMSKKLSAQFGVFRHADKAGNDKKSNDGYAITSRITGLVIDNKENHQLLHLGVGYSYRVPDSKTFKISLRPEAHLSHKFVKTGDIEEVDNIGLFNFEAAFVMGSLSLQGEYTQADVHIGDKTESLNSYYGMATYFLTGEKRPYKNSYAGFSRVKPKHNFGKDGGMGAFELTARYSSGNLNGKTINGGQLNDITLGINWYLNPATRIMLNFVLADKVDYGKANIFQTRFQIDF